MWRIENYFIYTQDSSKASIIQMFLLVPLEIVEEREVVSEEDHIVVL